MNVELIVQTLAYWPTPFDIHDRSVQIMIMHMISWHARDRLQFCMQRRARHQLRPHELK